MLKNNPFLATSIAYLFHPIFVPCYFILVLFYGSYVSGFNRYSNESSVAQSYELIGLFTLFVTIIPLLIMFLLVKFKLVSNLQAKHQEERPLPFIAALVSGVIGFVLILSLFDVAPILILFYLGYLLAVGTSIWINYYTKLSIHMVGISGVIGTFIVLSKLQHQVYLNELLISFFIAGLIGYSRLKLDAHTTQQILIGFSVGLLCELYPLYFLP